MAGEENAVASARQLKTLKLEVISPREFQALLNQVQASLRQATPAPAPVAEGETAPAPIVPVAVAVDDRTKTVLVRGTKEQIEEVLSLAKTFDKPLDQLKATEIKNVHVFPVQNVNLNQINSVLSQLQIQVQILPMGKNGVVILTIADGDKDVANQVKEVLATVDVADKVETVAAETK